MEGSKFGFGLSVEVTYGVVSVCGCNKWVGRSCWEKHCHHLMLWLWLWLCLPIYVTPSTQSLQRRIFSLSLPHIIKDASSLSLSLSLYQNNDVLVITNPLILVACLAFSSVRHLLLAVFWFWVSCWFVLFLWITQNGVGWMEMLFLVFDGVIVYIARLCTVILH